jgi:iron complex transport system substrate-binding protein
LTQCVARATGKQAEAATLLSAFDAKLAEGRSRLTGRAGQSFVFADAYAEGSQVSIRPFAKGSLISDVTEQLGLANAWTEPGDELYGLAEADVEGLTTVGQADNFLYIATTPTAATRSPTSWARTRCGNTTPHGWSGSGWTAPDRSCSDWPACSPRRRWRRSG